MYDITYNVIECHDYSVQHAWHDAIVHTSTAVFGYRTGWCGLFFNSHHFAERLKGFPWATPLRSQEKACKLESRKVMSNTGMCAYTTGHMSWGPTFFKILYIIVPFVPFSILFFKRLKFLVDLQGDDGPAMRADAAAFLPGKGYVKETPEVHSHDT